MFGQGHVADMVGMWGSEDDFWESILPSHHVRPESRTQVTGLTASPFILLSRLEARIPFLNLYICRVYLQHGHRLMLLMVT